MAHSERKARPEFVLIDLSSLRLGHDPKTMPQELFQNTWVQSDFAYDTPGRFTLRAESEIRYVAFPGTCVPRDWGVDARFVQADLPDAAFPVSLNKRLSCAQGRPRAGKSRRYFVVQGLHTAVHEGFLRRFEETTASEAYQSLCSEVQAGVVRAVIFSGHSLGGAIATLAALSFLCRQDEASLAFKSSLVRLAKAAIIGRPINIGGFGNFLLHAHTGRIVETLENSAMSKSHA